MKREIEGFIFKGYAYDQKDQMYLKFFGKSSSLDFQIIIDNEKNYFFATANTKTIYQNTDGLFVDKVEARSLKAKKELKEKFDEKQIGTYEFDVRPIERYLMDQKIYGSVKISGECQNVNNGLIFRNPEITPVEYYPQFLSFLSFDIETAKSGEILSIAYQFKNDQDDIKKVLILGNDVLKPNEIAIEMCPTEINLIQKFQAEVKKLNPDLLIGWNVIGFDLKYIFDRCDKLKIKFDLSRDEFDSKMFNNARGEWMVDIPGRVVIDGPWALKMNFFNFESFKLNEVAKVLLNETKDIDEDEVFDKWSEIERRYREDKIALARYNLKDAELVTQIFEKTKIIDLLINRSIISGMLLDKVGGSTAAFDHFFLPEFHAHGLVAPNVIDVEWDKEAKGGFVLSPIIGIHDVVVVLDFKSLYPTVIRTFYIDPLSRIKKEEDSLITPVGIRFSRKSHILPNKISELLARRAEAKKAKNENLSMAIKILMNSFYGVMGSSGCRFYHSELPDAITGTGQWILKTTIEFLEQKGLVILYGDTDSIFVKMPAFNNIFQDGKSLVQAVNGFLQQKIKTDFNLESHLEIQFDKVFKKLILTSTRGNGEGAKKRYAGLKINEAGEEEIVLTGMEFVRSDWSRLARNFQFELVKRLFNEEDVQDFILETIKRLENGEYNSDLILRKRLTKPIEEYIKNVPPHVKALKILYEKLGIRKKRAEYIMTHRGPMPIELDPTDIDFDYYIEKQLAPIANSLLPLIGKKFADLRNKQLTLF